MDRRRVDRAFVRFCRSGDAAALALVFDATAGELRRVARHLAPAPGDAEDLVQSVFLAAIERRGAYPPRAGALPWLLGILANLARRRRRAARRRLDVARLAAPSPPEPACEITARELHATLAAALRALPQPYRTVVERHVLHDATAREIAQDLGRPAGTVRTQLVRGLDLLRRALPVGLKGSAIAALASPSLAGTRAAVLAAARAAAPTGSAAAASGAVLGALTTRNVVLAAAAALALLAAWVALPGPLPSASPAAALAPPPAPRAPATPPAGPASPPAPAPVRRALDEGAQLRTVEGAQLRTPPAPAPGGCAVAGRVADTRGWPLAGVRIRLSHGGRARRTTSGPDGLFAFAERLGPGRYEVEHDADGVLLCAPALAIARHQTTTELALVRPAAEELDWLAGRVVDDAGVPLAGAEVRVGSRRGASVCAVRTDRAGTFRLARPPDVPEAATPPHARRCASRSPCHPAPAKRSSP